MKIGDKIVVVKELNDLQTKYKGLKGTIEIIREETAKYNISIKLENGLSLWVCKDEIEVMENKNERELKIRLKKNKRNQNRWGIYTYWLYEVNKSNGIKVSTSHINSNVELNKKDIRNIFEEVKKEVEDFSIVDMMYSKISNFLEEKKENKFNIITDPNQLNEILEYVKGESK